MSDERNIILEVAEDILQSSEFEVSDIEPSQWSEDKRVMSSEVSAFPGPFSYDRTPYLKEPINCLMPSHPAKKIAVMKGAQIGFSTGVIENGIGWIIDQNPGPILMMTGSMDLSKQSMNTKIDQMIDSCGLRPLIRPNTLRKKNQRTGDTDTNKEFPGGFLMTGQTGNHKKIRQVAIQYGFIDDFEAAPRESEQSGNTLKLIEKRFSSYYDKMKLFLISTPEIKQISNIEPAFLMGDQRFWNVPCPLCGTFIVLEWKVQKDKEAYGITYKLDKNHKLIPGSVGYTCQSCGEFFNDGHKYEMNLAGRWIPTADPSEPNFYSYHVSSLNAPPGTFDWEYYVREYLAACPPEGRVDQGSLKTFFNTVLGKTWEERGQTPRVNQLMLNTRDYNSGTIPTERSIADGNGKIVLITAACDLNGKVEDARLDWEIVAWSESGASYSVDHGSVGTFIPRENTLKVKKDRAKWTYEHFGDRSVWPEFLEIISKEYPLDNGKGAMKVMCCGVDSGYYTSYAYDFTEMANKRSTTWTVNLKGKDTDKFRRMGTDTHFYRKSQERDDLFLVEVNQLKDELAAIMQLRWDSKDGVNQPGGFMNFPAPRANKYTYGDYFSHFEGEHKVLDKSPKGEVVGFRWVKRNTNVMNHFWDVKIYNNAMKEIFSEALLKEARVKYPTWQLFVKLLVGKKN